jgi:sugar/nucleoside kinase (ribokinase family)
MNSPVADQADVAHRVDVLAIGHALVDVLAGADDEFLQAEGLHKGTMQLVDEDRAAELYGKMGPGSETSGGSAANTATGVLACGGTAAFIGVVADDQLGEIFSHDIRSSGVLFRCSPLADVGATGRSMIMVTPDGERTMNTNLGVAGKLSGDHLDAELLEAARITFVEGYLFDNDHPADLWTGAMKTVHAAGNRFAITLSDPFCVDRHRQLLLEVLEGADICFGNEEEVCSLFQVDDLDVAIDRIAERCEVAAITRGEKGSILVAGSERVVVAAEPTSVVDTTGAGDLYAAGVLAGLARGWDLSRCGRLGSRAAAAVVSRMGARLVGPIHPLIS